MTARLSAARAALHSLTVRRGRLLLTVLTALAVLLTGLASYFGLQLYQRHQEDRRHRDVLAAARQMTVNFTSIDYRHYERDGENVLKGATGDFREQFAAQTEELTKLVAENKSVSKGHVLEAGVVRADERSARVLVVADSRVTNTAAPEGQVRNYRLQLDLVHEDGRWLTSDIEFVG
ncbi:MULTISPECIES: hypothetical protein [Streptomyces]|jgi:Mce-associated membrane protein|uniref:Mce-associated membrane protein n=1 Tax=Streptomyces radiopugnans TaxID=403935 RepID=A0A1H9K2C6_9ACTN|nr:hypothetical protein [Streptomyces radiopugnans]URN12486.1 hypothetical protein LUW77_14895 [Streptomyces radiopugnans]SEQ93138.1 Mce-associated membrane protein [Streptomyces radiopugnans]